VELRVPTQLEAYLQSAGKPVPDPVKGSGLIDTGATFTMVDENAIAQLGVQPIGIVTLHTAAGPTDSPTYPLRLSVVLPGQAALFGAEIENVASGPLAGLGLICLIGRDILRHTLLIYDGGGGRVSISV
jgi:hypothetical protein